MAKLSFSFAAILGLLTAIGPLCSDFYLPALPEIATHLHTSTTLTQLSLTSALIGLGLGQLFFGPLSDRMGRKMPLLISLLLFVVASVLCATTQNIYALIGWRFVQGVAGAGGSVLARSIARDNYHGTMLTQFFALLMTVNGIAPVVSPVLGGYISSHFDWRMLFWVMAGAGLALLIASQLFIRESLSEKSSAGTLLGTAKTVLKNRRFMRFCLIQAFMLAGLFSYIGASSFVLQNEYGLSAMQFSLLFGVNGIGLIISALIFSRLARRHPSEGLMQIGLVLAVAAGALTLLFAWMHLQRLR
jgi:DHA1 family bicyclomycin/chloramphenicol resistance-like MFS transporter